MKTTILTLLTIISLWACHDSSDMTSHISSPIKAFSIFNFHPGYDIPSLKTWTYLFKGDTVIFMQTDTTHRHRYSRVILSKQQIDTINVLLKQFDFATLEKSKSVILDTNNLVLYCGPVYGFINLQNDPSVYKPTRDAQFSSQSTTNLSRFLYSLIGSPTNDTANVKKIATTLAERYIQTATPPPPLKEEAKFVPPIIKDDKTEK